MGVKIHDLTTPALIASSKAISENLLTMSKARPGDALRPHVKAHKCTSMAKLQKAHGHLNFTCATVREALGMAQAGLGNDLLIANEILDVASLNRLAELTTDISAQITLAVDSIETIDALCKSPIKQVLIDVNVGLPRCGCEPSQAGELAQLARSRGLLVRGVMGYEGHCVGLEDRSQRLDQVTTSMELLIEAHRDVGGEIISAGGTGTYDINRWANEIQAGSYVFMDSAYAKLGLPFHNSLAVLSTIISASQQGWMVCDTGLKSLGMDHGNPSITGAQVWFCSDEHTTFALASEGERQASYTIAPEIELPVHSSSTIGEKITVIPAHIDPTIAYHDVIYIISGDDVIDQWPIDLKGWAI